MLGAGRRKASLIAYAGWKVLGIYLEVKGKANLHPESVGPVCGCISKGSNRWAQPGRLISVGIHIKGIVKTSLHKLARQ